MERGLYIAATGMLTDIARQDTIASNLANVNTVGYKADRVVNESFSSLFLQNMANGRPVGELGLGARVAAIVTDFSQGALRNTQNPLDLAIEGDGFFMVQTSAGMRYTRAGQFAVSAQGYLTTQRGDLVLNSLRQPILVGSGTPQFAPDGRVFNAAGTWIGQIGLATLDIENAAKVGDNLWMGTETGGMPANTSVRQGFTEASGVNSVKEMVEMITTLRSYESAQRVVMSIDGTLDKAVNSVGVVG